MSQDTLYIFDTTLRDGEQSAGATMTVAEKLSVADILDNMKVDIIEAGFAIASDGDFEAIHKIAERTKYASVCSLARAKEADIRRAGEAVSPAQKPRIHTFISTSDIHLKYQINMTQEQVLEAIHDSVSLARSLAPEVEWSAMDATRTEIDYLCRAVETAIKAGAKVINIPDTVGYSTPEEMHARMVQLKERVPGIDEVILSVHCQNDLGLATANSLSAALGGARQVECTINGIGERAGNTSLEEVVMAIKTRPDLYPFDIGVDTTQIMRASKLVSQVTGFQVQNNKAIVGKNAFAHESGIHQDGVLKHAETYEIMTPESVGLTQNSLVLGKHSGRAAFKDKLKELGYELGDNAFEVAFNRMKELADKKKTIYDDDVVWILNQQSVEEDEAAIALESLVVTAGTDGQHAEMTLRVDGESHSIRSDGDGPIDAIFRAIRAIVPHDARLKLYQVNAVTQGIDAQGEVLVQLEAGEKLVNGNGADTDILVASAGAYISALNKLQKHAA